MFCIRCGAERGEGNFCPSCGSRQDASGSSRKASPPPPPIQIPYPTQALQRPTNGFAIASLVISLSCFGGILAVIFGHVALSQISRSGEDGRALAIAGLVIGYIGVVLTILYVLVYVAIGVGMSGY